MNGVLVALTILALLVMLGLLFQQIGAARHIPTYDGGRLFAHGRACLNAAAALRTLASDMCIETQSQEALSPHEYLRRTHCVKGAAS